MKQQIEQLIEGLEALVNPDKWCGVIYGSDAAFAHPVLIGDVLKTIKNGNGKDKLQLVRLWEDCDESKSLQEIFAPAECEWEEYDNGYGSLNGWNERKDLRPKDPEKRALAELLIKLFKND